MERQELKTKIKQVIARGLEIGVEEVSDDDNFIFDLGADSAQSIELVAGFEEEFDIEMDEDKALEIQNVSDAVDFIAEYVD